MKPSRVVNLALLCALLTGLVTTPPAPTRATQTQITYDCSIATGLPKTECEALVTFYNATDGVNWNDKTGWLQTTTPCTWYGITCETGHVTRLSLPSNNLSGALPPEIGNLTALKRLFLWDNAVTALPPEIGNLTVLEHLYLDYNVLDIIPPEIGNLTALHSLSVPGNLLTALPSEIGNLTGLYALHIGDNALTSLPQEIRNLSALHALYMGHNVLTALPPEIGNLSALTEICLNGNALTALPSEIGNLTALQYLDLSNNALTSLSPEVGNLTALTKLYLNGNSLSGAMPETLTTLTSLQRFTFFDTAWCVPETGPVPAWLAHIDEVEGTGQICGQALGSLSGTVTHPDNSPAAGIRVNLYRPIEWPEWGYVTTTHTHSDGTYQFNSLGQGIGYRVEFIDLTHIYGPQYYDDQPTLELATPVTVTLGITRTGIDAELSPAVAISSTPAITVCNNSRIVYQFGIVTDVDTTLHLYDPLDDHLTWQNFVGEAPDTLTYTDNALTGTVALSALNPITIAFAVHVNVPPGSFISEYAQVSNTAYYGFPDETLLLTHPSNTQVNVVQACTFIYLPLTLRNYGPTSR